MPCLITRCKHQGFHSSLLLFLLFLLLLSLSVITSSTAKTWLRSDGILPPRQSLMLCKQCRLDCLANLFRLRNINSGLRIEQVCKLFQHNGWNQSVIPDTKKTMPPPSKTIFIKTWLRSDGILPPRQSLMLCKKCLDSLANLFRNKAVAEVSK